MTLRKKTIDNSVRFVSNDNNLLSEQSRIISEERDSTPNTRMKNAFNENFSENNKKFRKSITREGFKTIKSSTGYTLTPVIYEISDIDLMLKS